MAVALALSRAARGEARLLYGFAAAIMGIAEVASLSRGGIVSLTASLLFVAAASTRMKRHIASPIGSRIEDRGSDEKHRRSRIEDRGSDNSRGSRIEDRESGTYVARARSSMVDPRSSLLDSRSSILDLRHSLVSYPALFMLLITVAIVAGVFWVGADSGLAERLADSRGDPGPASRSAIWSGTWTMIRAHPVLGVGLGAFETVYPIYGRGDGTSLIQFAHNDYLQALADGGIVAGALAVWFIIVTFRGFVRGVRLRDPLLRALALGAGAGIFAILVHSLFDFNLQLPSNALLFLVLTAVVGTTTADRRQMTADK